MHAAPRRVLLAALGLVATATAAAGCDVYDPSLLDDAPVLDACCAPPSDDAGMDAPVSRDVGTGELEAEVPDAAAPEEGGCRSRRPPARPAIEDTPSPTDDVVHWFVVSAVNLGARGDWAHVGYDLDGRCTTIESTDVECAPQPGFTPPNDGEDGIDNSFGQSFLPLIDLFVPDWEQKVNDGFRSGRSSLVARITDWNGTLDDPVVDVALVATLPQDDQPPPRFDGTDEYVVNLRGFAAGDINRPLARDANAYIVGGQLVARPRDGTEVVLSGDQAVVPVRLNGVFLTGVLSGETMELSTGVVAGRWPIDSIFDGIVRAGICPGTELHTTALNGLARAADLSADGMETPFMSCEAMSLGFGYQAVRARVVGYEMGPMDRSPCEQDAGVPGGTGAPDAAVPDAAPTMDAG